jgi:tetratricopeptide (TPR) repeat protein
MAKASQILGKVETWMHRNQEAQEHLTRAVAWFHSAGAVVEEARAVISLGNLRSHEGRPAEAVEQFRLALQLTSSPATRASALNNLANEYNTMGEYGRALPISLQAVTLWQGINDQHALANGWDTLGTSHQQLGHLEQAARCFRLAFEAFRELGNRFNEAKSLINYAINQEALGDTAAAHEAAESAVVILRDLNRPDAETIAARWQVRPEPDGAAVGE